MVITLFDCINIIQLNFKIIYIYIYIDIPKLLEKLKNTTAKQAEIKVLLFILFM
jgi:hypothetical protein